MRALLVYESMFGNTRAIALAIAEGIRSLIDVDTLSRVLALVRPRAGARLVSRGPGIREWLDAVLPERTGILATAFDTRIKGPEIFTGSAAKGAARRLKALRFRVVAPTSFFVGGSADEPFERISDAELERARAWGRTLGEAVAAGQLVASR
jgi:hypothetical protein